MSQAGLIDIEAANPQIPTQFDGDAGSAIPVSNVLEIQGLTVANATYAKPVNVTCSGNTAVVNVQVGKAITGTPSDSNDSGVASFNDTDFVVNANGYVSLIGSGTDKTITGDSGGALSPDGAGNWNILGDSAQGISSSGSGSTLTFTVADATTTSKGASSYNTEDFSITVGAVSLVDSVVKSVTTDSGVMTPAGHSFSVLGGEGIDVTHSGTTITVAGEDWSTTNKGIGELATDAETKLLAETDKALTPSNTGALFAVEKQSGFNEWTGAGSYYTINTTDFVLDRPGNGWIDTKKVTWAGAQTVASLSAGSTHYIYIDSAGTIGSNTTRSTALFQDNIVLYQALVDSDTPANVVVVKENHSLQTHPSTMNALHDLGAHGYDVTGSGGGTVAINGTLGVQVNGTTDWHDHDLETAIPDSSGAAVNWNIMYTNGAGKWVLLATQNTLPTQYNNAGTPTNLAGNERSIYDLRVSKDDLESAAPMYFAIMDDTLYANLAQANAARIAKTYATATNELQELETIRMGNSVINATTIDSVNVDKQFMGGGSITITNSSAASDVSLVVTNFDGWLTAADTTVQAAMDTLDDSITLYHGYIHNLGMSLASGVLTIQGADGNALSATNPGFVAINSGTTPGTTILYKITANQSLNANGAAGGSDIVDNLFGLTSGDTWGTSAIPLWVYAVGNDAETAVAFMCARIPHLPDSPTAGSIGDPSAANADVQGSMFSFEDITEADYDDNPCVNIGSFRAYFNQPGAADDYVIQAIDESADGVGAFQQGNAFDFPVAVNGASTNTHLLPNAGQAPVFSAAEATYYLNKDGLLTIYYDMTDDGGTDGTGAVVSLMALPFIGSAEIAGAYIGGCQIQTSSAELHADVQLQGTPSVAFRYNPTATTAAWVENGFFGNGARVIKTMLAFDLKRIV